MRYYTIETEKGTVQLPSVTTILDVTMPMEDRWKLEQARLKNPARSLLKQNEARERGNYIHRYVSRRLSGGGMGHGQYSRWLRRLDPWIKSVNEHNSGRCWVDHLVYDVEIGYAGTLDVLLQLPGYDGYTVLDIKTTAYRAWPGAIHAAKLQTAAYAAALIRHQWIYRPQQIASLHVSPYEMTLHVTEGEDLQDLIGEFYERLQLFGSRLTAATEAKVTE